MHFISITILSNPLKISSYPWWLRVHLSCYLQHSNMLLKIFNTKPGEVRAVVVSPHPVTGRARV